MSLWDDPTFKSAYDSLSFEDKDKYQRIGEQMYNSINYCDPKVSEYNYAKHIKMMLRDGLSVDDLTMMEKKIYMEAYGIDALEEYITERRGVKRKASED